MNSMFFVLLSLLAGGGGSDLLDYVSPNMYWQDRQVSVSVEAMAKELAPPPAIDVSKLVDDLNSSDPQVRHDSSKKIADAGMGALPALREAAQSPSPQIAQSAKSLIARIESADRPDIIRRLMAIRALGELKSKDGIAILQPFLKSDEPFIADYAQQSLDQIEGKPFRRPQTSGLREDVWLLPDGCRAVGQMLGPTSGPVSLEEAMKKSPMPPNAVGGDAETMVHTLTKSLITTAETIGNVRMSAITFGIAGDVGDQSGYVVLIARGQFDAHAIAEFLHKQQIPANKVGGVEMFQLPGAETVLFLPSNEYAVLVASPRGIDQPIQPILDAMKTHGGKLKDVPEMKKLIEAAPADQPIWAVAQITPAFAKGAVLAPFSSMTLGSTRTGGKLAVTIDGVGTHPDQARAAAAMINDGAHAAAEEIHRESEQMPQMKILEEAMHSVACKSTDGNATLTGQVEASQAGLLMFPLAMIGGKAEVHQAQPPPAPVAPK